MTAARAAAGFALALLGSLAGALAGGLIAAAAGADELTPAALLISVALAGVLAVTAVRWVGRARLPDLGLRAPRPGTVGPALAVAAGAFAAALAVALLAGNTLDAAGPPRELSHQGFVDRVAGLPDPTTVRLSLDTVLSVLARGVVGVVAAEIVLRGFLFAALARRPGPVPATAILAGLTALPVVRDDVVLGVAAAILSAGLCLAYLRTGSLLPGVAVAALAQGVLLGAAFDWNALETAALALVCAAAAAGLVRVLGPGPPES